MTFTFRRLDLCYKDTLEYKSTITTISSIQLDREGGFSCAFRGCRGSRGGLFGDPWIDGGSHDRSDPTSFFWSRLRLNCPWIVNGVYSICAVTVVEGLSFINRVVMPRNEMFNVFNRRL